MQVKMALGTSWFLVLLVIQSISVLLNADADAERLYDDLINGYNPVIRPVGNNSDRLTVKIGLKLSQLVDVSLKNQIMTTMMWVEQEWTDYKFKWDPEEYGGVSKLHVPSEQIWLPDIVLYNNADGNYEVTIMTKAILHHDGRVLWKPPAIWKSACQIDVEYFPFDQQTCTMKFGSWTYDGYSVDLKHKDQKEGSPEIELGIDLSEFYLSVEWDIISVPALRKERFYSCCDEPYPDISFNMTLRRKTLFYTVNLIFPCVIISGLSVVVFYLPSDSGEKVSLSISIMLSLGVFFLLLAEIIPPTSLAVPLLGRYLLFTMILVTLSVCVTILVLNVNFRSPSTHKMAPWVKKVFIEFLPKYLMMERPEQDSHSSADPSSPTTAPPNESNQNGFKRGKNSNSRKISSFSNAQTEKGPLVMSSSASTMRRRSSTSCEDAASEDDIAADELPLPPPPQVMHRPPHNMYMRNGTETLPRMNQIMSSDMMMHSTLPHFPHPPPPPVVPVHHATLPRPRMLMDASGFMSSSSPIRCVDPCSQTILPSYNVATALRSLGVKTADVTREILHSEMLRNDNGCCNGAAASSAGARQRPEIEHALLSVRFVAQHMENLDNFCEVEEDWRFVAMVLDRLFLWIFLCSCFIGTIGIVFQAPTLYDYTEPIDIILSKVGRKLRHLPALDEETIQRLMIAQKLT